MARQLFYRLASTTKLYFDFKISQTKKKTPNEKQSINPSVEFRNGT